MTESNPTANLDDDDDNDNDDDGAARDDTASAAMTQGPADDAEPTVAAPAARDLRVVEALLFVSAEPVPEAVLADRLPESADLAAILAELAGHYADRGVNLVRIGDGWALRTAPDLAGLLRRESDVQRRLSRAAIETVAIIAYHQPVTRAEIEQIRGVAVSKGTLDTLFECGWVQPRGRRRTPGRPATWVTSPGFLDHFGLVGLDDLPGLEELRASGLLDARPGPAVLSLGGDDDLDEEITHSELGQASEDPAADELAEDDVADGEPKARAWSNPNEAEAEVDYDDQAVSLGRVGARR